MKAVDYMVFSPLTRVDYIKITTDTSLTLSEAIDTKKQEGVGLVLHTHYDTHKVSGTYFDQGLGDEYEVTLTLYRKQPEQSTYKYLCTIPNGNTNTWDYGVKGDSYYQYLAVVENRTKNNFTNKFVSSYLYYKYFIPPEPEEIPEYENFFHTQFNSWTICNIEVSKEGAVYIKDGRTWDLGLNLNDPIIQNNIAITSWDTLGKYARVVQGNGNYDGMSFTGLLGRMVEYNEYTMPKNGPEKDATTRLVDRYTEKLDNGTKICYDQYGKEIRVSTVSEPYAHENDKLERWREFVGDGEIKLIRDMRGNAWVGAISEASSYSIANNVTTITFAWKEILDASAISIVSN